MAPSTTAAGIPAAAVAVAATVAIASGVIYVVMRNQLLKSADQQLVQQFAQIKRDPHSLEHAFGPDSGPFPVQPQGPSATSTYFQLVEDDGKTQKPTSELYKVPVTKETLDVASGQKRVLFANGTVGGKPARIYTVYYGRNIYNHGLAIQFVRPTDDIARTLHRLELILLLVVAGGIAAGAAGGALVSRAALVPVRRLTGAAERIARTGDPSERVADAGGPDELGRLGTAFNTMLAALEESIDTQRRFVADASHELRTPLTSLQTNIEVLKQQEQAAARSAQQAVRRPRTRGPRDARSDHRPLGACSRRRDARAEPRAVRRARRERCRARTQPVPECDVQRQPRADDNLRFLRTARARRLEPARERRTNGARRARTSTSRSTAASCGVRDHGPGIAADDKAHVFDRFYRSTAARSLPGSGLGLAIVREVAEAHGGTVSAEDAPGGGALLRLRLANS